MEHFQLHFEPQHRVLYQEPTGAWLTASWQDIATSPSIKRIQYNTEQLQNYIIIDIDNTIANIPHRLKYIVNEDGSPKKEKRLKITKQF